MGSPVASEKAGERSFLYYFSRTVRETSDGFCEYMKTPYAKLASKYFAGLISCSILRGGNSAPKDEV